MPPKKMPDKLEKAIANHRSAMNRVIQMTPTQRIYNAEDIIKDLVKSGLAITLEATKAFEPRAKKESADGEE